MADVIWLVPALPLAGFLILLVFGRRLGDPRAGWLATLMVFASFIVTVGVFFDLLRSVDRSTVTRRSGARMVMSAAPPSASVPPGRLRMRAGFNDMSSTRRMKVRPPE